MGDFAVTEQELAKFAEAFYGKHGDGIMTLEKLRDIADAVDAGIPETKLQEIMRSINPKTVAFKDIILKLADAIPSPDSAEDIQTAFEVFDKDKSGDITRQELSNVLKNLKGGGPSSDDIEAIMKAVDTDGDGKISYKEFIKAMQS